MSSSPPSSKSRGRWLALPVLAAILFVSLPLMSGQRTLFLRDVMTLHFPLKLSQMQSVAEGRLPLLDPLRAGGQPLLGNPNAVALYPDNLLYLVAPVLWALNAHFWLHWILAPLSMAWLARELGLRRDAAWAAATVWALGGYLVSQLNLYNLIAGVALAPALAAASLRSIHGRRSSRRWALAGVAGLVALQALAGDPMIALQAVGLTVVVVLCETVPRARAEGPRSVARPLTLLGLAGASGLLLAWPQVSEFLRILELSFRGSFGYGGELGVQASWDPRMAFEWLVPFAYGQPNLSFWGEEIYGKLPLLYSTFPGVLGLVLLLGSGARRRPARIAAWILVVVGLALSLGRFNPLIAWLAEAPGARLLRFPVKFWLLVAVGGSILVGLGWQRATSGAERQQQARRLSIVAALLALAYVALCAALVQFPDVFRSWVDGLLPSGFPVERAEEVRLRWLAVAGLQALICGVVAWLSRSLPTRSWAPPALLALHAATQLLWMQPLVPTDDPAPYRERPELLGALEAGESLVQLGAYGHLSGVRRPAVYPDRRPFWTARQGFEELEPYGGVGWGQRYELNVSAEGLDSFLTEATLWALRPLSDAQRLQILRSLGVDALILDRALDLDDQAGSAVALRARRPSYGRELHVYGLEGSAASVALYGEVLVAEDLSRAFDLILDERFVAERMAVVAGGGETLFAPRGDLDIVEQTADRLIVRTEGVAANLLVWQRSHLPLYTARIDGEPAPVEVANLSRIGLRVPPGDHLVEIEIDAGPFWRSLWALPLGALLLAGVLALVAREPRD